LVPLERGREAGMREVMECQLLGPKAKNARRRGRLSKMRGTNTEKKCPGQVKKQGGRQW